MLLLLYWNRRNFLLDLDEELLEEEELDDEENEAAKISNNVDFILWSNLATTQKTFFDIFKWDQNHKNHI